MNANERKCLQDICWLNGQLKIPRSKTGKTPGTQTKFLNLMQYKPYTNKRQTMNSLLARVVTLPCFRSSFFVCNKVCNKSFAFICVHLRDAQGCANAAAQRPPWMAEGRATQEQLPRCAKAAHFAFSFSVSFSCSFPNSPAHTHAL